MTKIIALVCLLSICSSAQASDIISGSEGIDTLGSGSDSDSLNGGAGNNPGLAPEKPSHFSNGSSASPDGHHDGGSFLGNTTSTVNSASHTEGGGNHDRGFFGFTHTSSNPNAEGHR